MNYVFIVCLFAVIVCVIVVIVVFIAIFFLWLSNWVVRKWDHLGCLFGMSETNKIEEFIPFSKFISTNLITNLSISNKKGNGKIAWCSFKAVLFVCLLVCTTDITHFQVYFEIWFLKGSCGPFDKKIWRNWNKIWKLIQIFHKNFLDRVSNVYFCRNSYQTRLTMSTLELDIILINWISPSDVLSVPLVQAFTQKWVF